MPPASVLWVMSGDCTLSATGPPMRAAACAASSALVASASCGRGTPYRASRALASTSVSTGPAAARARPTSSSTPGGVAEIRHRPSPPRLERGVIDQRTDCAGAARHRGVARDARFGEPRHRSRRRGRVGRQQDRLLGRRRDRGELFGALGGGCVVGERADQQDRVDPLRLADDLDEPRVADLVDRLRGAVDRVLRRRVGGKEGEDAPLDVVLQDRELEPVRRQDIGHPHRAAARSGDYRDAVAARQPTKREGGRDIEHMVEVLAADDAVVAEDRIVDIAGLRQCAGVRGRSTPPGCRSADLGDDQRLAGIRGLVGNGAEPFRAANSLEVKEEDVGAALVEPPIDIVMSLQNSLVAGADLMREIQLPVAAPAQEREGQRAALAADRNRPSRCPRPAASSGVDRGRPG